MDYQLIQIARHLSDGTWHALATELGFHVSGLAIPKKALNTWGIEEDDRACFTGIEYVGSAKNIRLMLVEGPANDAAFRRVVMGLHRQNPSEMTLWWWVTADEITAAFVDQGDHQ
ncbi:MAG: hypothetical protein ACNA8W_26470, partial [Bradymonadaceae bacterium]